MSKTTDATREAWAVERAIRKRLAEEIAQAIEDAADERADAAGMPTEGYYAAAQVAREFGQRQ